MSEIAAIDWLGEFINRHAFVLSSLGLRWLKNARQHLEDRIDVELRRTN